MNGDGNGTAPLIFLVAGEPSGDQLGAGLMAALKTLAGGEVRFAGVGGEMMTAQGLDSLFPIDDIAVCGLVEVIPHIPRILHRVRQTTAAARTMAADAVVTIDSPDFSFRVSRGLRDTDTALIHYVAPTVWAWKSRRAGKIAKFLDHLLLVYPFEGREFDAVGLPSTFVGHPMIESGLDQGDGPGFRDRHGIPAEAKLLCVLPGSRTTETRRHLGLFGTVLGALRERVSDLHVVVPTLGTVGDAVRAGAAAWPVPVTVTEGLDQKRDAFAASDAALAASGTVTLELALARVPMVVAYKTSAVTAWVLRRMVYAKYAALVNLILDRELVPEILLEQCTAERLVEAMVPVLGDDAVRQAQLAGMAEAVAALDTGRPPSLHAAEIVLDLARRRGRQTT